MQKSESGEGKKFDKIELYLPVRQRVGSVLTDYFYIRLTDLSAGSTSARSTNTSEITLDDLAWQRIKR